MGGFANMIEVIRKIVAKRLACFGHAWVYCTVNLTCIKPQGTSLKSLVIKDLLVW